MNQIGELVENYHLSQKEAPTLRRANSAAVEMRSIASLQVPSLTIQDTGGIRKTIEAGVSLR